LRNKGFRIINFDQQHINQRYYNQIAANNRTKLGGQATAAGLKLKELVIIPDLAATHPA